MSEILSRLNPSQQNAVVCTEGPVMVIAGAGSGKTRVLTYRIAYMLEQGMDPFHILALTFTNKAAREMKDRISQLINSADAKSVWMGTFHSIFARMLRVDGHLLGYPSSFTIYDTDDSKSLIKNILKDLQLDPKLYTPAAVLSRISAAKSNLISADEYQQNPEITDQDKASQKRLIGTIYGHYQSRLFKAAAMDFDDLLFNTNILLRDFPEILLKYQNKFRYILVDEYQDTNFAQYLIVKKLAARFQNICVVGDDAQSIYAFRGANIQNILNFKADYPEVQTFKLEQNYRSTKTIVDAANAIIGNNRDQIHKKVWTENEQGTLIKLHRVPSDTEEGNVVANSIFEFKMNNRLPNRDFAVLYRTNAQSRAIEDALRKLNIPYRIYGGLSFYKRKEIKDILAYFRLVVNTKDDEAFLRIINLPARGIGKTTLDKMGIAAATAGVSLFEVAGDMRNMAPDVASGTRTKVEEFANMILNHHLHLRKFNAFELATKIVNASGLMRDLSLDKTDEGVSRYQNAEELLNAIKEFTEREETIFPGEELEMTDDDSIVRTLDRFMQEVSLLTDADESDKENDDKVSLMTIHAAKGLEFPYVYVVGMEENIFPNIMAVNSRADLEEERRLFYVAVTRAEKQLVLSHAETRYRWGNLVANEPSRFIDEIEERFIEKPRKRYHDINKPQGFVRERTMYRQPPRNLKKVEPTAEPAGEVAPVGDIQVGSTVVHDKFGKGKVISIEGTGPNTKASVDFNGIGQKQLLLKFAKLRLAE